MPSKTHLTLQYQPQKEENTSVDMSNLYIKNLEPHISNYELSQAFRQFGRIISARVMTNPATGQSKGYGFVSFSKSEEAATALREMNGIMLGNRPLFVAYHEPRKSRAPANYYSPYNNYPSYPDYSQTTPINGLGINNVDELGMNMNVKELSIGQKSAPMHTTINLPPRKDAAAPYKLSPPFSSSPISGASTGKSLASLASGLSIQPPPSQSINIGTNGRPTLRRRGSLESVMTETSTNIQRTKLEQAVRNSGNYGKSVNDIVDMLLTLKRKERSLCLFNPNFLQEKIQLALDALATCIDSDDEDEDVEEMEEEDDLVMRTNNKNLPPPTYYQPLKKESKAIPIVAPKPDSQKEIQTLLNSLENRPTHEKKQLLGDKLFPLVKSTGTKQAPKVTIRLLDTVNLQELAHIMYDTQLLKTHVEEAFSSIQ